MKMNYAGLLVAAGATVLVVGSLMMPVSGRIEESDGHDPEVPGASQPVPEHFKEPTGPVPGRRVDKVFRPEDADLRDHRRVLGVVVNGQARAYQATGMSHPDTHVAIDQLGGESIAVAYCDRSDSVRAFCGDRAVIKSIEVDGYEGDSLQLRVEGKRHALDGDTLPLKELDVTYTTWGEWLKLHPDTDVYRGLYKIRF